MATHEQLPSTSSRSPLDPTTSTQEKSSKDAAAVTALNQTSADEKSSIKPIVIGTRRSALAVIQAELVRDALQKAHPDKVFEISAMATMGDKNQVTPLHNFGAKALWTHELEAGLVQGDLDLIVHCLKDMPTQLPDGLVIGCIMDRADPRDVIIMKKGSPYKTLAELPKGSVVGTSSVRRSAQIKIKYPHLEFADIRGNVGTRLAKLDAEDGVFACTLLAAAGMKRLGLDDRITQYLDSKTPGGGTLYAVGQGALAIEIKEGDQKTIDLLATLQDKEITLSCLAERSLMRALEGGCSVPIGVETEWVEKGKLILKAIVVSLDGSDHVAVERLEEVLTEEDANEFGLKVAGDLVEKGAGKILEAINLNRNVIAQAGGA